MALFCSSNFDLSKGDGITSSHWACGERSWLVHTVLADHGITGKGGRGSRMDSSVRQHPTIIYQTAWVIANCLTVVLGCGMDWITHVAGQPTINGLADWTCRVWQATFGVVRYIGGWTVVAMLVERYLRNRNSQLVKDYCSTCYVKVTQYFFFFRPTLQQSHTGHDTTHSSLFVVAVKIFGLRQHM